MSLIESLKVSSRSGYIVRSASLSLTTFCIPCSITDKPVLKTSCIKQAHVFKDQFFRSHKVKIHVILAVMSKYLY